MLYAGLRHYRHQLRQWPRSIRLVDPHVQEDRLSRSLALMVLMVAAIGEEHIWERVYQKVCIYRGCTHIYSRLITKN